VTHSAINDFYKMTSYFQIFLILFIEYYYFSSKNLILLLI